MRKIKMIMVVVIVGVLCFGTLFGCESKYYPEYESGFYRYAVESISDGEKRAYLVGLTEEGTKQTELVYPEKLDGIPVIGISYKLYTAMWSAKAVGRIESDCLKKWFFPYEIKIDMPNVGPDIIKFNHNVRAVYWNVNRGYVRLPEVAEEIFGYNYVEAKIQLEKDNAYIGNVSYLYNYDNAPDKGYYWVDSYDESVITFIPPPPSRYGYNFNGWYKEKECTNKWDFETEVTGKEFLIDGKSLDNNYLYHGKYEGMYLYAKWTKNQ